MDNYETFTAEQTAILERFVTNTNDSIFVLRNLPEVIMGALFSRYSRSTLGLRSLLLKEFIGAGTESSFSEIAASSENAPSDQLLAIKKAQDFYDRILDGYGDDSIAELGGAHLAIENITMIGAKIIEDCRIGGSPLEKSTRYIYFDQKVNGNYLYYRDPILMTSAFKDLYVQTCDMLFQTYSQLIPPLTEQFEAAMPHKPEVSKAAYTAALRAKVLDCLRGLLPAGTLTNMGLYGNGRFFEGMIHKLHSSSLSEMQDVGKKAYDELSKVIPSFVKRAGSEHHTHRSFDQFAHEMDAELSTVTREYASSENEGVEGPTPLQVRLVSTDPQSVVKVAAALLFERSNKSLPELIEICQSLTEEDLARILDAASSSRANRRHKSPRALEHAYFTFEIVSDFGTYRDLHRHRMLTQERQRLSCSLGYFVPPEIAGTAMEAPYHEAMVQAKQAYDMIAADLPEEAQYVVPMAYNVRWYFEVNLRALQWLCELRSSPAGHPTYRLIAQEMADQVSKQFPAFERFFKFVDYDGYDMGRMGQEIRRVARQSI